MALEQSRTAEDAAARSRISAIVVSYFTGPLLTRCVDSLKAQPEVDEIILVDNGNFPGDVAQAAANGGAPVEIEILTGHGNIGFAAACNKGAAIAKSEYLLFLNPDAMMPKGGAARFLKDAKKLGRPWLMGAMIVGPDGGEQQGSRRTTLTPWRAFVEATRLYKLAPRHPYFRRFNLHNDDCPDEVVAASTISGACFFLPKADYAAIGGMDERYFLHVEDVDFCLRFRNAGGEVYFDPHVRVIHYKSSSRANPMRIEARKTASLVRYFNVHFADAYPKPFLWAVGGLMWLTLAALFLRRAAGKGVRLAGLRRRAGERGVKRARTIAARRSAR
jgi:hypothetical protein